MAYIGANDVDPVRSQLWISAFRATHQFFPQPNSTKTSTGTRVPTHISGRQFQKSDKCIFLQSGEFNPQSWRGKASRALHHQPACRSRLVDAGSSIEPASACGLAGLLACWHAGWMAGTDELASTSCRLVKSSQRTGPEPARRLFFFWLGRACRGQLLAMHAWC